MKRNILNRKYLNFHRMSLYFRQKFRFYQMCFLRVCICCATHCGLMVKEASVSDVGRASRNEGREPAWRSRSEEASDLRFSRNLSHVSRLARDNEQETQRNPYRVGRSACNLSTEQRPREIPRSYGNRCRILGRKWRVSRFLEDA